MNSDTSSVARMVRDRQGMPPGGDLNASVGGAALNNYTTAGRQRCAGWNHSYAIESVQRRASSRPVSRTRHGIQATHFGRSRAARTRSQSLFGMVRQARRPSVYDVGAYHRVLAK